MGEEKAGDGFEKAENRTKQGSEWPVFRKLDQWAGEIDDPGRWSLLRDALVFQGKLALDALRDLALSPLSLFAVLIGFLRDKEAPGRYFYALMRTGRRSDHMINLFGAADHAGEEALRHNDPSVDNLVKRFEDIIVREYEAGGMTAQAKGAIDRAIDIAQERVLQQLRREAEQDAEPPAKD